MGSSPGIVGKKTFETLWGMFDDEEAPDPKHRAISFKKLMPALLLEGAIFRAIRGLFDHGKGRHSAGSPAAGPGDDRPEPT